MDAHLSSGSHLNSCYPHTCLLFDALPFGIVYQNLQGEIISANPSAEKIFGLSLDQMRGVTFIDPRWQLIDEDGSPFHGLDHPAMVTFRTGTAVLHTVMGVFNPLCQDTHRPVQFEITEQTRESLANWIKQVQLKSDDYLFNSRIHQSPHLST